MRIEIEVIILITISIKAKIDITRVFILINIKKLVRFVYLLNLK